MWAGLDSFIGDFMNKSLLALEKVTSQWPVAASLTSFMIASKLSKFDLDPVSTCLELRQTLNITNATVLDVSYYSEPTSVKTLGTCWYQPTWNISVPTCRVQFVVNTSDTSAITAEAWLPTEWYGRILSLGNGGLGGCIDYQNLEYGTSMHFASVASDNGHDGDTGEFFENSPEVLNDFTSRSIHVETVVGKQIAEAYYGRKHRKSYYLGCSTGGRQATYAALHYPEDFDGIVAGAPGTDWNNLMGWKGMIGMWLGAPNANSSSSFIPPDMWDLVSGEILRQCDELDGLKDGIISEPDACDFRPEAIQCSLQQTSNCLTREQVGTLRKIYEPFYGTNGQLLFPRYDPGAEAVPRGRSMVFSGHIYRYTEHWMRYAIYNDTNHDFSNFGLEDIALANKINPGGISAYTGDMAAFKAHGGKFLTYHGRKDELVPSGNSKRMYNVVSRKLGLPNLDSFYRLYLVPGLEHCFGGAGPVNIGQHLLAAPSRNVSTHNVLLAIVDWVEKGIAQETITGLAADGVTERVHCRYPQRSIWNGSNFTCIV